MITKLVIFILYGVGLLWIGFYFNKVAKDSEGYLLGGRNLGPIPSALSAGASDMSAWLMMGLPGLAYTIGLASIWLPIGLFIGVSSMWILMAKPLRRFSIVLHALTIPEYLSSRFHDKKGILKIIFGITITIFFIIYMASGFVAAEKILLAVFHIYPAITLIIILLVILVYTMVGGYTSVVWTDALQGGIMMLALLIVPIVLAYIIGSNTMYTIPTGHYSVIPKNINIITIISYLGWGLGYFAQPHIIIRFMGIRSAKEVNIARITGITWTGIGLVGALLLGVLAAAYLQHPLKDPETVMFVVSPMIFPMWIAALIFVAIISASMSTVSSQLLVTVSSLKDDIAGKLFSNIKNPKTHVWIYRILVFVVMLVSIIVTFGLPHSILKLVSFAWGGIGSAFGPVLLFSLYYRRMTLASAISSVLVGTFFFALFSFLHGGIFDLYALVPGFITGSITIFVVSAFSKEKAKEQCAKIFDDCQVSD